MSNLNDSIKTLLNILKKEGEELTDELKDLQMEIEAEKE